MKVLIKAPAKINLALNILSKREDGYHDVEMIMQTVSLYDKISITLNNHNKINLDCKLDFLSDNKKNTAYIAAQTFFEFTKIDNPGIDIVIEKNIPQAAGLAGGSADAAGVIVGLDNIFNTKLCDKDLINIGSKIGADVPFSILGGTMAATGIGTELRRLNCLSDCCIVIVKPSVFVSTKEAYEKSDNLNIKRNFCINDLETAIDIGDINRISSLLFNKFEDVIDLNEVKEIKKLTINMGALNSCMSGSGPSVFSIFTDIKKAQNCVDALKKKYKDVFICNPVRDGAIVLKF